MAILVTGGARSGKSGFAEQYALRTGGRGVYIATCQPYDEEMAARIDRHRDERTASGFQWETIEEPYEAADLLDVLKRRFTEENAAQPPVVLLDCLTLWLSNWLLRLEHEAQREERLEEAVLRLLTAVRDFSYPLIMVTNEVGDGIVPTYPLGRWFRDEAGRLNQRAAAICERVFLVTAGIPLELKTAAFKWEQL